MSKNFAQRAKDIVAKHGNNKAAALKELDSLRREQFEYEQSMSTDREIENGVEVEKEHKPTLDFIKKYYKENNKFPTLNKVAKSIAVDHVEDMKKNPNNPGYESYYKGLIDNGLSDEVAEYMANGGNIGEKSDYDPMFGPLHMNSMFKTGPFKMLHDESLAGEYGKWRTPGLKLGKAIPVIDAISSLPQMINEERDINRSTYPEKTRAQFNTDRTNKLYNYGIGDGKSVLDAKALEDSYMALGGFMHPMNIPDNELEQIRQMSYGGNVDAIQQYRMAEGGGIHIDPSKRGTFTAAATKHGAGVQEFASRVLANKENYSPAMVKKANFARNAASWKHSYGGPIKPGIPYSASNANVYADGNKLKTFDINQPLRDPRTTTDKWIENFIANNPQFAQMGDMLGLVGNVVGAPINYATGTISAEESLGAMTPFGRVPASTMTVGKIRELNKLAKNAGRASKGSATTGGKPFVSSAKPNPEETIIPGVEDILRAKEAEKIAAQKAAAPTTGGPQSQWQAKAGATSAPQAPSASPQAPLTATTPSGGMWNKFSKWFRSGEGKKPTVEPEVMPEDGGGMSMSPAKWGLGALGAYGVGSAIYNASQNVDPNRFSATAPVQQPSASQQLPIAVNPYIATSNPVNPLNPADIEVAPSYTEISRLNQYKPFTVAANDPEFEAFLNAISGQESGGDYGAKNARTGASGKYQIMPSNWPSWSAEAGLPPGSPMTPENQELVARAKLREYYSKYGAEGAAMAWYAGPGSLKYSDKALNRKQGAPGKPEPSIIEYRDDVMNRLKGIARSKTQGTQDNAQGVIEGGITQAPAVQSQADYKAPFKFDSSVADAKINFTEDLGRVKGMPSYSNPVGYGNGVGENQPSANSKFGESMRYAPVAFNAIAGLLAKKSKPMEANVNMPTMSPTLISPEQLSTMPTMNQLNMLNRGNLGELAGATGGSGAAMRSGIQGLNLGTSQAAGQAIADIYAKNAMLRGDATKYNAAATDQANRINLGQMTQGRMLSRENQLANMQDEAAVNQYRNAMLGAAAEGVGKIGTENWKMANARNLYGYDEHGNKVTFKLGGKIKKHKC